MVGASLSPYACTTGRPNFASNAARIASGQSAPPTHTSCSDARSVGATAPSATSEWKRGALFHSVTASQRTHPATPGASPRSMITWHPPACAVSNVVRTCMLRMVSGSESPLRSDAP